jgi:hypothetical protein
VPACGLAPVTGGSRGVYKPQVRRSTTTAVLLVQFPFTRINIIRTMPRPQLAQNQCRELKIESFSPLHSMQPGALVQRGGLSDCSPVGFFPAASGADGEAVADARIECGLNPRIPRQQLAIGETSRIRHQSVRGKWRRMRPEMSDAVHPAPTVTATGGVPRHLDQFGSEEWPSDTIALPQNASQQG